MKIAVPAGVCILAVTYEIMTVVKAWSLHDNERFAYGTILICALVVWLLCFSVVWALIARLSNVPVSWSVGAILWATLVDGLIALVLIAIKEYWDGVPSQSFFGEHRILLTITGALLAWRVLGVTIYKL